MRAQNCELQTVTLVLVILIGALLILYTLIWFGYMWRAFRDLQKHQYMHYKMGNLVVRMQVHTALLRASVCILRHDLGLWLPTQMSMLFGSKRLYSAHLGSIQL